MEHNWTKLCLLIWVVIWGERICEELHQNTDSDWANETGFGSYDAPVC